MNDHNKLSEETTVSRMAFDEMFKCADDYWNQLLEARKKNHEMQTFLSEKVKTIMELEKKLSAQSMVEEAPRKIVGWKLIKEYPGSPIVNTFVALIWKTYYYESYPEFWQPIYSEPNPPVCELPDENDMPFALYKGDYFWYVDKKYFTSGKEICGDKWYGVDDFEYFWNEAAALKFVRENKGVYPESLVYDLMDIAAYAAKFTYEETKEKLQEAITKLNQYKAKQ